MSDVDTSAGRRFLIKKNGYYYRPNSKGYTSSAILAGRYTMEEAEDITHPNGPDGPRDGMSFIAEHICPDEDWQAYMALRTQLAEAQKPAPKGYPINLLVSGTIQAHQIAEDLGSGKIDKMEPFTRYDAARNALAEARDSAGEVWHSADLSEGLAPGESYLIYLDGGVQITALWVGKWMARGEVVYPTHWRQLPEPPRILSALADTELEPGA